jgi:hypothetical protein
MQRPKKTPRNNTKHYQTIVKHTNDRNDLFKSDSLRCSFSVSPSRSKPCTLDVTIIPDKKLLFNLGAAANQSFIQGINLGTKGILLIFGYNNIAGIKKKWHHHQHCTSVITVTTCHVRQKLCYEDSQNHQTIRAIRETDARCNPSSAWQRWGAAAHAARPRGLGPGHDLRVKSNLLSSWADGISAIFKKGNLINGNFRILKFMALYGTVPPF